MAHVEEEGGRGEGLICLAACMRAASLDHRLIGMPLYVTHTSLSTPQDRAQSNARRALHPPAWTQEHHPWAITTAAPSAANRKRLHRGRRWA
ncbi:hypothetical protein B0I35DRAFT_201563 [Stachybotrys elegans]|uniref:Uncharacterized protein n=1 Tax=Stachybotrys elegans TaxID=80388 RepID=A0A8K0SY04_9HYPO|nr:hypothetical protein B0I35DRAFT_201563 [Stachybotrys elegans]